jgi:hypothetical protein
MNDLMTFAKTVPYFPPNSCAWGHAALGFGMGFLDPWAQVAGFAAFVFYEYMREKPMNEKVGAVAEFATGFLVQKVAFGGKS